MERRRWTSCDDHHLISAYRNVPTRQIAETLNRTFAAVRNRIFYLGATRDTPRWSRRDDRILIRSYGKIATKTISKQVGRSQEAVYGRAWLLGLMRTVPPSRRRPWNPRDDARVKALYGKIRPVKIAQILDRSVGAVHHRALKIGLASPRWGPEFLRRQSLPRTARPFWRFKDPTDLGYVAGILDGEGSIGPPPRVFLSVTSTTRALTIKMQKLAGGSLAGPYRYQKTKIFGTKRYRVKPQYRWNFASRYHVYLLLKAVQPYLVVKGREANRAIRYFEAKLGWGKS